jgi:hypothetical protein
LLPKSTGDLSMTNDLVGVQIDMVSTADSHCDIALLRIDTRTAVALVESPLRIFPLAFSQATTGQKTLGFDYSRQHVDESGAAILRDLRYSEGTVEEVHNTPKGFFAGHFPSFRTNAHYLPCVSGGPVFSMDSGILGVISHGMIPEDGSGPCAYAASIDALAELRVELEQDDGTDPRVHGARAAGKWHTSDCTTLEKRDDSGVRLEWLTTGHA